MEALKSSLMGLFEKKRMVELYKFIQNCNFEDPKSWNFKNQNFDLKKTPMNDIYKKAGVEENTIDFLGHAVALHYNDTYLVEPALETIKKMQLYLSSQGRYGNSPFLYPIYGVGGLPESFSRLCAIHGGTYMLNTDCEQILYDESGKVTGITSGGKTAKAPLIVCDPSYAG